MLKCEALGVDGFQVTLLQTLLEEAEGESLKVLNTLFKG